MPMSEYSQGDPRTFGAPTFSPQPAMPSVSGLESEAKDLEREAQAVGMPPMVLDLLAHIEAAWSVAKENKQDMEQRLFSCRRQLDGVYDPEDLAKIEAQNQPVIYMMLTQIVSEAGKAWLKDVLLRSGERAYSLDATPIPDLPPEIIQAAAQELMASFAAIQQANPQIVPQDPQAAAMEMYKAAQKLRDELKQRMKKKADEDAVHQEDEVDDELIEGGWYDALDSFIDDLMDYPFACITGPEVKKLPRMEWVKQGNGSVPQVVPKLMRTYRCVNPHDLFWSPGARNPQEGNLFERIPMSRKDLNSLRGVPGFSEDNIRAVLVQYPKGFRELTMDETTRATLEGRPDDDISNPDELYDCVKFMGSAPGSLLLEWGLKEIKDIFEEHEIVAYKIGSILIGARVNSHPLKKRNYYVDSFRRVNGAFAGKALAEVMKSSQRMCNGASRAIAANMAIASGPQVWVNSDRLPPGVNIKALYPWQIHQFTAGQPGGAAEPPMAFYQPSIITDQLLGIFKYYFDMASEESGIPRYIYGSADVGGAGKTASGLSMLMNAAAKGLKKVTKSIDRYVIEPSVEEHLLHIFRYSPEKARGDLQVQARASEYLMLQEQLTIRRQEYLNATNNPTDIQILGIEGRAKLHREQVRSLKLPADIIPDEESIQAQQKQAEMVQAAQRVAQATGMAVEQAMAIMSGQMEQQAPQKPQATDPAGNKAGGQDAV